MTDEEKKIYEKLLAERSEWRKGRPIQMAGLRTGVGTQRKAHKIEHKRTDTLPLWGR